MQTLENFDPHEVVVFLTKHLNAEGIWIDSLIQGMEREYPLFHQGLIFNVLCKTKMRVPIAQSRAFRKWLDKNHSSINSPAWGEEWQDIIDHHVSVLRTLIKIFFGYL